MSTLLDHTLPDRTARRQEAQDCPGHNRRPLEDGTPSREGPPEAALQEYDIVVPTIGRPCLARMLDALLAQPRPGCRAIFVVDDRPAPTRPLDLPAGARRLASGGRGPAAARNAGWRAGGAPWVVFLDDDVVPPPGWAVALAHDLAGATGRCAGTQGSLVVPLPAGRRPTDWERNVAGLMSAKWATADMAYRRSVLEELGGFDERFPRAFREDADIALRVLGAGYSLVEGKRHMVHPVRPAGRWVSVRLQRGNADDALMRALHGRAWRRVAQAPGGGRMALHVATLAAALGAIGLAAGGRRRGSVLAAGTWACLYAEFVLRRVLPGPRDAEETVTMLATSALIPPAAVVHRARGELAALVHRPRPVTGSADG